MSYVYVETFDDVKRERDILRNIMKDFYSRNPNHNAVFALSRELNFHWRYVKANGPYIKNGPEKGWGSFEDFCQRRNYCLSIVAFFKTWGLITLRQEGSLHDWIRSWEYIEKEEKNG